MTFWADILGSQMMNPTDFGDPYYLTSFLLLGFSFKVSALVITALKFGEIVP